MVRPYWALAVGLQAEGAFGENLLCEGMDSDRIFLGDVYRVSGSELLLQATSPRRPCANVDVKHGQIYGVKGVRNYCASSGCAGTFFRVLREGTVREGSKLILESRRGGGLWLGYNQWSMRRLSHTLYAQTKDARYQVPLPWAGTRKELIDLSCGAYPELAHVEWGEVLQELLERELQVDGGSAVLRQTALLIWGGLCGATYALAPPIREDWQAWCVRLLSGDWQGENALIVAEFNLMGLWPLLLAAQCTHGLWAPKALLPAPMARFGWLQPPLWVFLAATMCLGCFVGAPGVALCATAAVRPGSVTEPYSSKPSGSCGGGGIVQTILSSRWFASCMLGSAVVLAIWGGTQGDLQAWRTQVRAEGFAMVMSLDFLGLWLLSVCLAWARDQSDDVTLKAYRWLLPAVFPLAGTAAWLLCRCGATASEAAPLATVEEDEVLQSQAAATNQKKQS